MRLLAQVDEDLGQMSGLATRVVLHREHHVFGYTRFERLAGISASHIYNLRGSRTYRTRRTVVEGTKTTTVSVGERRAPQPDGMPGFLRVDTVHQGDRGGAKGVYLINVVDEVTQYEFVGAVAAISERFLVPVLDGLLGLFPFAVVGFHADNGSEYVNHTVAALLNKLHVRDFTKSRPRRSTDNALVEGKNANVVRRFLGHDHIPQRFAPPVDAFAQEHLSPYLNYHRPCLFATEREGANGRVKRVYRARDVRTPYDKLRVPARRRGMPAARCLLRGARRRGPCRQRPAGRPGTQRRTRTAVPDHSRRLARRRVNRRFSRQPRAPGTPRGSPCQPADAGPPLRCGPSGDTASPAAKRLATAGRVLPAVTDRLFDTRPPTPCEARDGDAQPSINPPTTPGRPSVGSDRLAPRIRQPIPATNRHG